MNSLYLNPINPTINNPVNLDELIQDIQLQLKNGLSWLIHSFGRATRATELRNNKTIVYPEVFRNDGKFRYIDLSPSRDLINYCFFVLNDPIQYTNYTPYQKIVNATYNIDLIFWFDFDKINKTINYRFSELLKQDIFFILNNNSNIIVNSVFEEFSNVWRSFVIEEEVKAQYFKQPHGGFRFNLFISHRLDCITAVNNYTP